MKFSFAESILPGFGCCVPPSPPFSPLWMKKTQKLKSLLVWVGTYHLSVMVLTSKKFFKTPICVFDLNL
jgi:hypothetical protein